MGDTTDGKLSGIEVSRGIAATTVVLYHAARHLDHVYGVPSLMSAFQFGHAGVDLFFVISGFIILYVHYRDIGNPARIGHYLGRRFSRVMPTYWVAMGVALLMAFVAGRGLPSYAQFAWSVSLLPSNSELVLGIAWTLRFEIAFYAVFCILILNRTAGIVVFGLWLGLIVLAVTDSIDTGRIPHSLFHVFNLQFFFGMAGAYVVKSGSIPVPRHTFCTGIVLFVAVAAAEDLHMLDGYADISRIAYGVPAALIVVGTTAHGRRPPMPTPPLLRALGSSSYSIYLFQFIFIGTVWQLWLAAGLDKLMPHIASFPLLAMSGVIGGVLVSRFIEYPLIRLVRRNRRRTPAHTAVG